jgi:hypothetical protein
MKNLLFILQEAKKKTTWYFSLSFKLAMFTNISFPVFLFPFENAQKEFFRVCMHLPKKASGLTV